MSIVNYTTGTWRIVCLAALMGIASCASTDALQLQKPVSDTTAPKTAVVDEGILSADPSVFPEIWAYLVAKEEHYLDYSFPITDIGYFGAEINTYGELSAVPERTVIGAFPGRVHLVVICESTSLTHFCLDPKSYARSALIDSLIEASKPFDGLQIDFELVPKRDGIHFLTFLSELKSRLGNKILSVAIPARLRVIENDVYDYRSLSKVADKVLVMAYDEHWSSSEPGPIASLDWCDKIVSYALETIDPQKLIMGLPFYGRTWGNVLLNRAYYFSGIQRILRENDVKTVRREDEIPTFVYTVPEVLVTGYYEDVHSLSVRLNRYSSAGVRAVGFWRLGQEDPRIWENISVGDSVKRLGNIPE